MISFAPSTAVYDAAGFGDARYRVTVRSAQPLPPVTTILASSSPVYFIGLTNGQVCVPQLCVCVCACSCVGA